MCGIFGYVGYRTNAPKIILEGLKSLEYRGYDSWGVAAVTTGKIYLKKRIGKIGEANVDELPASSFAFGHTRWATHGGVTDINAHPHLDCSKKIALIHNGIIENYEEIKKELIKKGHSFISETDTEVAAHLIEEYYKQTDFISAVKKAFNKFSGLSAIMAINTTDNTLAAARNGSPLVVGFGKGENFIASDSTALLPHTKTVHFMEDNEMAVVTKQKVSLFDVQTGKQKQISKMKLNWQIQQAQKGKYPYFMLKEIYEQPEIITNIAQNNLTDAENLAKIIRRSRGCYMVGCGTAAYICLAGTYLFSKIAQRHINTCFGSEFGYQLEFLNKDSLIIALSQSGETMDILESVKKAKNKGAKIFALVNVLGSTLYREAHYKMLVGAGPEKGVASTKASTGKLAHLILLSYAIAGKIDQGQKVLFKAVRGVKKMLLPRSIIKIKKLARKLKNRDHILVIGRGLSYAASLETALKIKEISYIHAEGLAAGELKHGPLALVEKGSPCIVFAPNDETYGANLAGAMEMKARGGYIIGVSYKPHEIFDYYIEVEDAEEATIIPNIVFAQLLAYYLTVEKGLDPDKPRNLAKSVTVK